MSALVIRSFVVLSLEFCHFATPLRFHYLMAALWSVMYAWKTWHLKKVKRENGGSDGRGGKEGGRVMEAEMDIEIGDIRR